MYDSRASSYLFNLNDKQVVDAGRQGNRSRFLNHSKKANAHTRIMAVRGDHHIGMYAERRIEAGEEIFFDYRYEQEEREMYGFREERRKRAPKDAPARGGDDKRRKQA